MDIKQIFRNLCHLSHTRFKNDSDQRTQWLNGYKTGLGSEFSDFFHCNKFCYRLTLDVEFLITSFGISDNDELIFISILSELMDKIVF
ncbi:hypothetical protein CDAR_43991 [Caerostris darwini]|uniref:Uncharacterized protein n=1 Tax=Caerostris darwini TaxID=1538125 RepID=A0AAV4WI12_9ARAC|nr:hypothetical protein CDAR_43991 [Caerostris darwini]